MSDELSLTVTEQATQTKVVRIDRVRLLRMLARSLDIKIPDNASVTIRVPGGGDWSNMALDLSEEHPVVVQWEETKEPSTSTIML